MNVIVFTNVLNKITASHYQEEYIKHLSINNNFFFYGKGYPNYNSKDNFLNILAKSNFGNKLDMIIFAHSWLIDDPKTNFISYHKDLKISKDIPVVGILNKEYVNLEKKLQYFKSNKFDLIVSHYLDCHEFENKINKKFLFQQLAADSNIYKINPKKDIDLFYSGNMAPNYKHKYSHIRKDIHDLVFNRKLIFRKKNKKFKNLRIHWKLKYNLYNSIIDKFLDKFIDIRIPYANKLSRSKLCFNAISPANLVNTRHFEALLSGTIPLCYKSKIYSRIENFENHIIQFSNKDEFIEKLKYYLDNPKLISEMSKKCYEYGKKNHTWEVRAKEFYNAINSI